MKKIIFTSLLTIVLISGSFAQSVGINADGTQADASAMLDVKSTTKGFLPPRVYLNSKWDSVTINKPAFGLMVYNTNSNVYGNGCCSGIFMYNGINWAQLMFQPLDSLVTATYTSENWVRESTDLRFQTFTATQTGILASLAIFSTALNTVIGSRPIKLYSGAGNTGLVLSTMTLPGNSVAGFSWETATRPLNTISIIAGQTYTIETSGYLWGYTPAGYPDVYAGGYSNDPLGSTASYGFKITVIK